MACLAKMISAKRCCHQKGFAHHESPPWLPYRALQLYHFIQETDFMIITLVSPFLSKLELNTMAGPLELSKAIQWCHGALTASPIRLRPGASDARSVAFLRHRG